MAGQRLKYSGLILTHFCFHSLLLFPSISSSTVKTGYTDSVNLRYAEETSTFIEKNIVSSHLSKCSSLITTVGVIHSSQSILFNYLSSVLLFRIHTSSMSATTLISHLNGKKKPKHTLLRFTSVCKVVISMLPENSNIEFLRLIKILTSTEIEFTRKDEDYYIFVAASEDASGDFLQSNLALLIRYKIIFHPNINELKKFRNVSFRIRTLCHYCPNTADKIIPIQFNSKDLFKTPFLSHIFPDTIRHLHQFLVRVSAPTKYVATYEMENVNGQYRHKRGLHAIIFNIIADKLNLSYTLRPCSKFGIIPEGASGVWLGNGTWAGCMGDVVAGVSDLALSVSPDDTRFQYVHFSSAMEYAAVTFITSKPSLLYSWKSAFTALKRSVWGCIIVSIILTSIVIHLLDNYHTLHSFLTSIGNNLSRLSEIGLYLGGYIVGQDVPAPNSFASKLVYITWLFCGLVIGAVYSCSLQSLIVSPGLDFIPRTFSDLVHSQYRWGAATAFRNGLGEQLFKTSNNPVMRDIYHKMDGDTDEIECTRKALSNYACFNWDLMELFHLKTYFADKSGNHPFQMAQDSTFFTSISFITRKRELYRSYFNNFMARSFDSGLIKRIIAMDWRNYRMAIVKARREGKLTELSKPVTSNGPNGFHFDNVKGCFIVLACGKVTAFLSFLLEKLNKNSSVKRFKTLPRLVMHSM